MTLVLLSLLVVAPPTFDVPLTPDQRAAWIVALRATEFDGGKDSWSQSCLREARAAVHDPTFSAEPLPDWWFQAYVVLLDYYLFVWLAVFLAGALLVWRSWRRNRLGSAFLWASLWFASLVSLYLAIDPATTGPLPAAVVRLDGTVLRQGNGLSYPPRFHQGFPVRLAAGVEARVRSQRPNGWIQLELPHAVIGWVPQDAVYLVRRRDRDR